MAILYPDGISGPPKKRKGKLARKGKKKPGAAAGAAGAVTVGARSAALVPTSSGSLAAKARQSWPWILAGLAAMGVAFWYTGGGRRRSRPLGFG